MIAIRYIITDRDSNLLFCDTGSEFRNGATFKSGGYHSNCKCITQVRIYRDSVDEVSIVSGHLLDIFVDQVYLVHGDLFGLAGGDIDQNIPGAADIVVVEQGRVEGSFSSFACTVFPTEGGGSHDGY